jgi:hypothetical protein
MCKRPLSPSTRRRNGGAARGPAHPAGRRRGWLPVLVLAVLAVLVAGGCRGCGTSVVELDGVQVSSDEAAAHPALGLDAAALARHVEGALRDSQRFRFVAPERGGGGTVARLHLDGTAIVPASGGRGRVATVALELELRGAVRRQAVARGEAELPADPGNRGRAFVAALDRALARAVADLEEQARAEGASDAELVASLSSGDPDRADLALRLLVERKSPAAVDPLLARLGDPQPEEVLRAASALAAIGDPRAAPALIEAASRRDPEFVARIATALGDLGGPEAEAYLFTAAAGHPDPGVRDAAREALDTLRSNRRPR